MAIPLSENDKVIPVRGEVLLDIFTYRYPEQNGAPDVFHQHLLVIGWVRGADGTMRAVTCRGVEPFPEPDGSAWRGGFLSTRTATTHYHARKGHRVHDVPALAAGFAARDWDERRRAA